MKKLKNQPLSVQIWLIFTLVILIIFALLSLYFSITIRSFFTDEIYNTIEIAQENTIQKATGLVDPATEITTGTVSNDIREVKHIRLNYSNDAANLVKIEKIIPNKAEAELFLQKMKTEVKNQTNTTQRYIQTTTSGRLLYVLRVNGINKNGPFVVSYMWDTYRNSLATNLMIKLFPVMIIAIIISIIAAKYLAQKLVIPLKELETKVKKIGKKQWNESINLDRDDEIGELSKSIEEMRKELLLQDEYEQTMLQQASHDLKTPLMVIRSYAKAVEDGIYPKGDMESTMKVIDFEAERMQKRVKNLLYFTKIKYLLKHKDEFKKFHINHLVERIVDSFIYNNKNVKFQLNIADIEVIGDEDQWTVVFENIIDNALRYANDLINITISENDGHKSIIIYNDGEKIPQDKLNSIFDVFKKGTGGNFGLGLDIAKRIVNMYGGKIIVRNETIGVSFIISL